MSSVRSDVEPRLQNLSCSDLSQAYRYIRARKRYSARLIRCKIWDTLSVMQESGSKPLISGIIPENLRWLAGLQMSTRLLTLLMFHVCICRAMPVGMSWRLLTHSSTPGTRSRLTSNPLPSLTEWSVLITLLSIKFSLCCILRTILEPPSYASLSVVSSGFILTTILFFIVSLLVQYNCTCKPIRNN